MKGSKLITLIAILLVIIVIGGILYFSPAPQSPPEEGQGLGSITTGQEYQNTSTPFDTAYARGQIKRGAGTLGSVIITYAGNTEFRLLDATSTVAADRPAGRQATSSVELVRMTSGTLGTYVFDLNFVDGLYLDIIGFAAGNTGTSTITWR